MGVPASPASFGRALTRTVCAPRRSVAFNTPSTTIVKPLPVKILFVCVASVIGLRAYAFIDASLQMQLGNPSNATADTNNFSHYLIQRPIEALDYNNSRGQANWASWDLTSGDANNAVVRQDSYAADTSLPANFYEVGASEYSGSGFDRGHLYMANCHSSGDWQFKQPVAMALPTVILKASCLRCWAACFLPGRVAG